MTIPEIQQTLTDRYRAFLSLTAPLTDAQFYAPTAEGKWSVAETLQHLYLSARPVARLLAGPRDGLHSFGKPVGPSRPYAQLVADYRQALVDNGIKAPASMSARAEDLAERATVENNFAAAHQRVVDVLANWTDDDLESYQVPHPAMGLLTLREMLYFTAYHILHHLEPTRNYLSEKGLD
ncbi:DinB family protein [Rudanella paleaurantiibacter]|uniref:DinB family protein n=1 Tax=Rudanella paleaurantiibacter TaxID=2614655 RepID=A0A7J5U2F9_9BACT|nr:DinB family protein [Rudanella paleaurantiibacter]KAB7731974.1 DinB family protein [Rudanella paleaurantiibacter]